MIYFSSKLVTQRLAKSQLHYEDIFLTEKKDKIFIGIIEDKCVQNYLH